MPKARHPRRGSMQFWPRKRSKHSLARVRSWSNDNKKASLLGFICYKAGMTHLQVVDNAPKSITKGENIFLPVTIMDCPPMKIAGVVFYKKFLLGMRKVSSVMAPSLDKSLTRKVQLPKKQGKKLEDVKVDYDDLRLLAYSAPQKTSNGSKKPKLIEIALGGSNEEKLAYAKEKLGKEVLVSEVVDSGSYLDVHGISKGKGFQGTVKRFGVPIRQHKSEKVKRGIGNLGAWTPKRVDFRVPQSGKMGYHLRTEYNKRVIKVGEDGKDVTAIGGIQKYGIVKNNYLLLKGSVVGPRKRAVLLTKAIRPDSKAIREAPEISYVSLSV